MMDMQQYLGIFIEETKEHLQGLNESLLKLEQKPNDTELLNEIFRVAHTLKGMSGTMGFGKMAKLTHDMENVLHALRSHQVKVNSHVIDTLFKCLDVLEIYLNSIINIGKEEDKEYPEVIKELDNIINNNAPEKDKVAKKVEEKVEDSGNQILSVDQYEQNVLLKARDQGLNAYQIKVVLNKGCVLKSARAFIVFKTIEKYSEIIKSVPPAQDIEDEKFELDFTVIVVSKHDREIFVKELTSIAEVDEVVIIDAIDIPLNIVSQQESRQEEKDKPSVENNVGQSSEAEKPSAALKVQQKPGKTVRVDIDRLDVLMNLVSELIIIKTRLEGTSISESSRTYNETIEYFERITTSLHDAVMKVRMVPVENVFNRFPRMIRDIAKDLDKEIVLSMSGEETELDRTVIDEIGDPLIHLLRNSADHGLETTEKRIQLKKSHEGHIYLRAYQDGNNVVIEVEDDGQGIDIEKVKKKAIDNGLISSEAAKTLTNKEIIDFLFRPSFSTADKVTGLSGRGVGLDVVKSKIESLGGAVEVETERGKGSKFIIRLPLTLAIIQALLVIVGEEKYAIPLNTIKEIINISPSEIKLVQHQEVILLRNTVVPIIRLDRALDVVKDESKEQKQMTVVIVKRRDKLFGFLVDSLIGQQEIVIKSIGKLLSGIKAIAGATILGDGNVALIIDVNSLA